LNKQWVELPSGHRPGGDITSQPKVFGTKSLPPTRLTVLISNHSATDKRNSHYRALDFRPGAWINLFGRPVYLYDCDNNSTRPYLQQQFGDIDFRAMTDSMLKRGPPATLNKSVVPQNLKFKADMVGVSVNSISVSVTIIFQ
jgi:hypothetical protein